MELAKKHLFTVDEYRKMGEAGIFGEDDRVELIEGEVVEMAPIGTKHMESVVRLNRLLSHWVFNAANNADLFVSVQNPLHLSASAEPQPDLVLLKRGRDRSSVFSSEEALLVVEVADTSLRYDREDKLPLYASAGIPEAWIVNLREDVVEVYADPGARGYRGYGSVSSARRGEGMTSPTVPGLMFEATEILPPEE